MSNMDDEAAFYSKYQGDGIEECKNNDASEQDTVKKSAIQENRDIYNKNDNSKAFTGVKVRLAFHLFRFWYLAMLKRQN